MDPLVEKYKDCMRLVGYTAKYELADDSVIEVKYKESNFLHLIGLHKLVDIQTIQFWQDKSNKSVYHKDVVRQIKKGALTDEMIKKSYFYPKIEDRYEKFSYES